MCDRFEKPTSEKPDELIVCSCGAEVESTTECPQCTDDVCEECGSMCWRCGELYHTDCLIEDKDDCYICQPCFDAMCRLNDAALKAKHSGKVSDLIELIKLIFGEKK